ncbi:MAG: tripartite tricarboxylate transporter permease [Microthrixaceae bacterium]
MDIFANLLLGLQTAASAINLLYCLARRRCWARRSACCRGWARWRPSPCCCRSTFGLPPVSALIMLAGIFYGAQYGGSTTAILVNLPGESSSVVTALDGHEMATPGPRRQGAGHGRVVVVLRRHGVPPC